MPTFVREERINEVSPGASCLLELAEVFRRRAQTLRDSDNDQSSEESRPVYTIRCLDTVYKVFSPELLSRYFLEAEVVRKVTFQFETALSRRTHRRQGAFMELSLEEKDPSQCYLAVAANDETWVEDSFAAVQDVLDECRTDTGPGGAAWPRVALDVAGCALGLAISAAVATQVSPLLPAENSFSLSFFFTLLVFMTTWTIAEPQRHLRSLFAFPNMKFRRHGAPWPWPRLVQAFAGARGPLS